MVGKRLLAPLLCLGALASSAAIPGVTAVLAAEGEEQSSMPQGWHEGVYNESGEAISSPYLYARAYKDPSKGNSVELTRRMAANKLKVYSDSFSAPAGSSIKIGFFARNVCLDDEENRLVFTVVETKKDGSLSKSEVTSFKGRQSDWKPFSGYFDTTEDCQSVSVSIEAFGWGDFYVSGVSLKASPAPYVSLKNWTYEDTKEDQVTPGSAPTSPVSTLTTSVLTDDAYSGDRALRLSNTGIVTCFGPLPKAGKYELRFKFKHTADGDNRLQIRMDCVDSSSTRLWYVPNSKTKGTTDGWSDFKFSFTPVIDAGNPAYEYSLSRWIQIFAYGTYLIDELQIVDESGMNYLPSGSFDGYDVGGLTFTGNAGLAENPDGSFSYYGIYDDQIYHQGEASMTFPSSDLNLEDGKTYTLSYEAFGGNSKAGVSYYDGVELGAPAASQEWTSFSTSFTAKEGANLKFNFNSYAYYANYIRNISILDETGEECFTCAPKKRDPNATAEGQEIFPYGNFDYDFPEDPSSSSETSSLEDSFSRESKDDPFSSASYWTPSSETGSSSLLPDSNKGGNRDSDGKADVALGLSIGFVCLSALTLGGVVFLLIKVLKK